MRYAFTAYGIPVTQGSARAFYQASKQRAFIVKDNDARAQSWRAVVASEAAKMMNGQALFDRAIVLRVRFVLPRPKSAPKARLFPDRKPDIDKLLRAMFDAMTGIVYADDARIVEVSARKHYGDPARAEVEVFAL